MATIYGKATDLIDSLSQAIKRGEPLMDMGPDVIETGLGLMRQGAQLVDRAALTLERCDQVLSRLSSVLEASDALLVLERQNAALTQRKLELELLALEARRG